MQKICIHLALQLFIENHPESNSTADDDSLLLTTAERAAEVKGCSYLIIYTQCLGEITLMVNNVSNYMYRVVKNVWVMPQWLGRSPK